MLQNACYYLSFGSSVASTPHLWDDTGSSVQCYPIE